MWALALVGGFVMFTETHKKAYRWTAGIIHGLAHLSAALLVAWAGARLSVSGLGLEEEGLSSLVTTGIGTFIGGYLIGSFLLGLYLLISLNVFRRHANEAFPK